MHAIVVAAGVRPAAALDAKFYVSRLRVAELISSWRRE